MAKRFALYFGAAGYLLVIWYHGFALAPVPNDSAIRNFLYHACPMCVDMMGSAWWSVVLGSALVNGALYAVLGLIAGSVLQKLKRPSGSRSTP